MESLTVKEQIVNIYDKKQSSSKNGCTFTVVILGIAGVIFFIIYNTNNEQGVLVGGILSMLFAFFGLIFLLTSFKEKSYKEKEKELIENYFAPERAIQNGINPEKVKNTDRGIKDDFFDAIIIDRATEFDLRRKGLEVLGLDDTQISELPPVCFGNYYCDDNNSKQLIARGKDGIDRTSSYQVTWLFPTAKQLCIYQYTFDILADSQQETTQEYFWKDINNLQTSSETVNGREQKYFLIQTAGGDYECVYKDSPETRRAIQGMKAYFRDIKSA